MHDSSIGGHQIFKHDCYNKKADTKGRNVYTNDHVRCRQYTTSLSESLSSSSESLSSELSVDSFFLALAGAWEADFAAGTYQEKINDSERTPLWQLTSSGKIKHQKTKRLQAITIWNPHLHQNLNSLNQTHHSMHLF